MPSEKHPRSKPALSPRRKAIRRRVRHARRRVGSLLLPHAGPPTLRWLSSSWKLTELHPEHFDQVMESHGRLTTLWHGRMIMPMAKHRGAGHRVLVSPSDDGSLVVPLLKRFGYGAIRGSSNKNPARALREMVGSLKEGGTIVITPDGPRGPRHRMNPGPAWMSKATGFPVLPVGCACDRAWRMNSWDEFTIPKPRARVCLSYAEPLWVPRRADDAAIDEATRVIGERMMRAERDAFLHLGIEPDWRIDQDPAHWSAEGAQAPG